MGESLGHQCVTFRLFPETKGRVLLQDLAQPVEPVKPMEAVEAMVQDSFTPQAGQRCVFPRIT
jgi:hypothetical protein